MKMHRYASRSRQRGLSFLGLVLLIALGVAIAAIGVQSVPIFMEYIAAKRAIERAKAADSVDEVRASFDRAAAVSDIHSIKGEDLEVTKQGDKVVVSFKYERVIGLIGPAYLLYRFNAQTN